MFDLIQAIMDETPHVEAYDEMQFAESLAAQEEECKRHYAEFCKNERWSYVPG